MKHERLPLFDVMRLFLALEVFLIIHEGAHLGAALPDLWCPLPPVPCFLAISGYLVLQSLEGAATYWQFAKKRLLRVMPALIVSLLLYVVLFGIGTLRNNLTIYFTAGLITPTKGFQNGPLWSLPVEEVAYVGMAILFAVGWYRRKWPIALIAAALFATIQLIPQTEVSGRFLPVLLAFPVGSLVYLFRAQLSRVPMWIVVPLFALAIAHPIWGWHAHWLKAQLLFITPAVVVMLCAFAPKIPLPKFPDLSYGIYIYHMAVLQWCAIHAPQLDAFVHLGIVVVVCVASWYLVEFPILKYKNRPWRFPRRKAPEPKVIEALA